MRSKLRVYTWLYMDYEGAKELAEQLEPAFAGYLMDGEVSERDAVATIFRLIKKGVLEPEFKDDHILHGIVAVRKMSRRTNFTFERQIVDILFQQRNRIALKDIGKLIKRGVIQRIIMDQSRAITEFPIVRQKLRFSFGDVPMQIYINNEEIDTVSEAEGVARFGKWIMIVVGVIAGLWALAGWVNWLWPNFLPQFMPEGNLSNLINIFFPLVIFLVFFWWTFTQSTKQVTYDFENQVVPVARERYMELFDFLTSLPPRAHDFTYEFIPYAIAFGIDTSWQQDFGLATDELKLDEMGEPEGCC